MGDPHQVLKDPKLDRRLRRDGFTVVPLLAPAEADALRARFLDLRGRAGDGFSIDLTIDDQDYRRAADRAIAEAIDERGASLFIDRRPFLRSFLGKYQGEASEMYLHQDWMYVDERVGQRTYVTWVALQDITGDNGILQVIRGSHEFDRSLRGTALVSELMEREDELRDRLLDVPIEAGQAIVFDNGLIHASHPNYETEPRVAAAVAWRRSDTPLVHFLRSGDDEVVRYDIDEEFFFANTPVALLGAPPDLPVVERIPWEPTSWTTESVRAAVAAAPLGRIDMIERRARSLANDLPRRAAWSVMRIGDRLAERYGRPPVG